MYNIELRIKGCKSISELGEFIRNNHIKLVLFGEYHGFVKQIQVQRKILRKVLPNFFLYELFEENKILSNKDAKKFLNKLNNEEFSFVSTYGQLKPIIRLARSFNLPIIGCDVKNMAVNKNWRENKFSKKEAAGITRKRELRQAKVINEYTSKGLVFALLGDYHLRKNSLVLSKLETKAIIVRPSFKWGDRFNYVKKFKDSETSYFVKLYKR